MIKFGLHIVILAFALNNLPLMQFAKLPVLLEHFKDHQRRDASITMLDFLSMHYWGTDINDNDDNQDRQLPFKNISISHVFTYYIPFQPLQVQIPPVTSVISPEPSTLQVYFPDAVLGALFRPPQA